MIFRSRIVWFLMSVSGCLSTKITNMICWMHWINIPASVYYTKAFIWPNVPEICSSFALIRCWENTTLKVEDTCSGLFDYIHYEYAFFNNSIVIICRCLFCSYSLCAKRRCGGNIGSYDILMCINHSFTLVECCAFDYLELFYHINWSVHQSLF